MVPRASPVPRCLRRRLEPSMQGRGKALVCVDAGAAASLVGYVQGVPKYLNLARTCNWSDAWKFMVSSHNTDPAEHEHFAGACVWPCAGRAGSSFDMGTSPGKSAADSRHRAVDVFRIS
ncbi:unnamed protein product [Ectocarpus sp. 4 AP-2014]